MVGADVPVAVIRPIRQSPHLAGVSNARTERMPKKISDIRRDEIVHALLDAVQSDGVSLPSYDQIARKGDMSRQLVRHYYRDVEQMAVDLCDHLAETYRDHLIRGILHADPADRLRVFLDFYFDFLAGKGLAKPKDDSVYDALFAYAGTSERVRENLREQYTELLQTLAHEMQITHTSLPQAAARELAYLVVTQMYGHWKMKATLGMDVDSTVPREAIDRLITSYIERYEERGEEPVAQAANDDAQAGTVAVAVP